MNAPKADRKGFSLIELLIAASLLLIVILGAGQMVILSWHYKLRSEAAAASARLAADKVESLRAPLLDGEGGDSAGCDKIDQSHPPLSFSLSWSARQEAPGLQGLEIMCVPGNLPTKKTEILVYLSAPLGF